jgi:hypothetical protein
MPTSRKRLSRMLARWALLSIHRLKTARGGPEEPYPPPMFSLQARQW